MTNNFFKKFKEVEGQEQAKLEVEKSPQSQLENLLEQSGHKAVVVMSYNSIDDYSTGIYNHGQLVVFSGHLDSRYGNPEEIRKNIVNQFKEQFGISELDNIKDLIEHVIVYIGGATSGKKGNLMAAVEIAGSPDKISIYHCDCGSRREVIGLAEGVCNPASIVEIECRGRRGLSRVCRNYAQPSEKNEKQK